MDKTLAALPLPVYEFDTLDSTSTECRRRIGAGERRCLVLARTQTDGRGRSGRSFFSPPGGLYLSLAMPAPEDPVGLTCRAAVITADAIERLTGLRCGIKWVNDLYLDGKKVCGILTEAVNGAVIVGVGVNLTPTAVPEELRDTVGFLGRGDVRVPLAAAIAAELLAPPAEEFMAAYRARSIVLGRQVCYLADGAVHTALAVDIDAAGGLVVEGERGRETLTGGEIRLAPGQTWN